MADTPLPGGVPSEENPSNPPSRLTKWLVWVVSLVLGAFLLVTVVQVYFLQQRIGEAPKIQLSEKESDTSRALIALEVHSVE